MSIICRLIIDVNIYFDFDFSIKTLESDMVEQETSFVFNTAELMTLHEDTYDNLLQTIDHHEALMVFYYMDDSDKVISNSIR